MERFIAKRFSSFGGGLALDTGAISKYTDLIDLSIGDTDIVTDEKIISAAFRDAKAGHTHYGDPHGDEVLVFSPYFPMYREQIELAGAVYADAHATGHGRAHRHAKQLFEKLSYDRLARRGSRS